MKHLLRATSTLALLAFAAPALPCGDKATTTAEKSTTSEKKEAVAKSDAKKPATKEKAAQPKTATN